MLRLVVLAGLASALAGCRVSLETVDTGDDSTNRPCVVSTASAQCMAATMQNPVTLTWIQQNIFTVSCNFSGCHSSASDAGKLDLKTAPHDHLVDVPSMVDRTRKLVVPSDVNASYLMLMLRDVPPALANPPATPPPGTVGYMPQGSTTLCCQKLDALERWINAGAPNN
jgi:hypothetical protein